LHHRSPRYRNAGLRRRNAGRRSPVAGRRSPVAGDIFGPRAALRYNIFDPPAAS